MDDREFLEKVAEQTRRPVPIVTGAAALGGLLGGGSAIQDIRRNNKRARSAFSRLPSRFPKTRKIGLVRGTGKVVGRSAKGALGLGLTAALAKYVAQEIGREAKG